MYYKILTEHIDIEYMWYCTIQVSDLLIDLQHTILYCFGMDKNGAFYLVHK